MHGGDRLIGQRNARVELGDRRVVPLVDLAQVDARQRCAVQRQGACNLLNIEDGHDGPGQDREHLEAWVGIVLFLLQQRVGAGEVDGLVGDALLAAAGADALVVDRDRWVDELVGKAPFRVHGLGEGGAGASHLDRAGRQWGGLGRAGRGGRHDLNRLLDLDNLSRNLLDHLRSAGHGRRRRGTGSDDKCQSQKAHTECNKLARRDFSSPFSFIQNAQ